VPAAVERMRDSDLYQGVRIRRLGTF